MCGFVGWVNLDKEKPVDLSILKAMNQTLEHRGPDDEGYFAHGNVGIGHRRLSIIDTSHRGRQPIFNEDQTILVVHNGEIYNYPQLKAELIKDGHLFSTHTDTEVIVHAYEKWGIGFLNRLDGMFSLALYDIPNRKLILAKDPFGKKPLYYTMQNSVFLFASELKAFFPNPHFRKVMDLSSLCKYLAYEYVPTPHCIFKDCKKLPAASYLALNTRNLTSLNAPKRYWEIEYEPKWNISVEDAEDKLLELFRKSVKKRLVSDVPLGVFLSGGVDSSSIVALMAEFLPGKSIKTFNIGFEEKSFDESRYARKVSDHYGTDHYEDILHPETMFNIIPKIIENLDEPFADPSIIPTYLLCKFTKQYVTVALGGDGGDELFAGYDTFLADRFSFLIENLPYGLIKGIRNIAGNIPISENNMDISFRINHFLKGYRPYTMGNLELRNNVWLGSFCPDVQRSLFTSEHAEITNYKSVYEETIKHKERARSQKSVDRLIDNYISLYLHDDILVKVDHASMMNSLEVRTPFLDKNFTEFVNRLPVNMKMKGVARKFLLNKSFNKILPSCVINRSKKGFGIPIARWFRGPMKNMLLDTLSESKLKKSNLFNTHWVERLVSDHISKKRANRKEIWTLLVFELWKQHHGI